MRRPVLSLLAATLAMGCGPAAAHDFWLQPKDFRVGPDALAPATLQVGHGPARQRSPISAARIIDFRSVGPDGVVDQKPGLRLGSPDEDAALRFSGAGTQIVALATDSAFSNLPAIRFNDYLAAEGLTPALLRRTQLGAEEAPGRELYSRRAKAIVQVGPVGSKPQPQVVAPIGLTLEIVPDRNPYELRPAEPLPVHVLYEGRPLEGALLKLTDLDADERPVDTQLTDALGRASFTIPHDGSWLLNVIWTTPLPPNRTADYLTTFSSLSFGYGDDED